MKQEIIVLAKNREGFEMERGSMTTINLVAGVRVRVYRPLSGEEYVNLHIGDETHEYVVTLYPSEVAILKGAL